MKTYTIPAELFEGLLNYLASRPYAEVGQAMAVLTQVKPNESDSKE